MVANSPSVPHHDVVIVGGSLAGAATALLLRQRFPQLDVLVVDRSPVHQRRVGEATVEVAAYFLSRVLGLSDHLNQSHLVKQGLRFWHKTSQTSGLGDCSEIGPRYQVRVPSYLVDRAVLDQEVLDRAEKCGVKILRSVIVQEIQLEPGETQTIRMQSGDGPKTVTCRWVVDASGPSAMLARQEGWLQVTNEHPTAAAWARWRGVRSWEDPALARQYPKLNQNFHGIRQTATNHLMGDGWWAWMIPLQGGDVSVGIVFDQRLVSWPTEGSVADKLKAVLSGHPVARELMADAECIEGDVHWRRPLAYVSRKTAGDGFVLVGDAAGFLDPFYSPGMDWLSYTVMAATELIGQSQVSQHIHPQITLHNERFARCYHRWFHALYKDKYHYLGEHDLLRIAFRLDLGLYYLGIASQPYRRGPEALLEPTFTTRMSTPFYLLMRWYNQRLARIAQHRRTRGVLGKSNEQRRYLFGGYTFEISSARHVIFALIEWGLLELKEGWRTWFRPARLSCSAPTELLPQTPTSTTAALR